MANANTNLMSMLSARATTIKQTSRNQISARTNRTNPDTKNSKSNLYHTSRHEKNNFGAELDKANAQINNAQPEDAKVVAENVESESVNTLDTTSNHEKTTNQQDAPKKILTEENSQPQVENIVAAIIPDDVPAKIQPVTLDDAQQNILPNVDAEIILPKDTPKIATEILINPADDKHVEILENPAPIVQDKNLDEKNFVDDTTDNSSSLATSADMAYYFASSMDNLLIVEDTPVKTDEPNINLMSIMPQTRDDKAQSMLNHLSGKTWESPKLGNETVPAQNLNLQSLTPQIDNQSTNQALPIMPQYQPRPLNFQTTTDLTQPTLQAQPNLEVELQPTLNQPTLQAQPIFNAQNNLQQINPQVQPTLTSQNNFQQINPQVQPTLTSQNNLQQINPQVQPTLTSQNNLQQINQQVQPTLTSQNNLQQINQQVQQTLQTQNNFQQINPQVQPDLTSQNNFQQNISQVQSTFTPQNNLQQINSQVQPTLMTQNNLQQINSHVQPTLMTQNNFQQINSQVQPDLTSQNNFQQINQQIQPDLTSQNNFQPINQQVQSQQFGAQIQPQINSLQPQAYPRMVNQQTVNNMLGVEMQVEDNLPTSTPVMPLQSMTQYFEQNPQSARDFRQNFGNVNFENETQTSEQANTAPAENFVGNLAAVNHTQTNQPVAQVQSPEVMQAPREDFNVPAQIVEQARMIRTATNTEMVINLKPEHLGELTLRVSVSTNGAVTASFYSDNAQVRAIIENTVVQLKQELNDQGIKVDNVEVYAGLSEDGLLNGQGQQAWQQNQQRNPRGQVDFEAVEEEIDALNPIMENVSADGVDYKV